MPLSQQQIAYITDLNDRATKIARDPNLSNSEKKARLDSIHVDLQAVTLANGGSAEAKRKAGMYLDAGGALLDTPTAAAEGEARRGGAVPKLPRELGEKNLREAYARIKSGGSYRATLGLKDSGSSANTGGELVPAFGGLVPALYEPTRVLDLLQSTSTAQRQIEYILHSSTTGGAAPTAEGALIPQATINTTKSLANVEKIAVHSVLTDEIVADWKDFLSYVNVDLARLIIEAENDQLLNGNGTAPNLLGILNVPGILTLTSAAGEGIDAIQNARTALRNGPSFCEPDTLILHPSTWNTLRLTRDGYGRYLLGDPSQAVDSIWSLPVSTTTKIAQGTGILLNSQLAGVAHIREGQTLSMTNSGVDDSGNDLFRTGQVAIRCEERLALAIERPSAVITVTGIS